MQTNAVSIRGYCRVHSIIGEVTEFSRHGPKENHDILLRCLRVLPGDGGKRDKTHEDLGLPTPPYGMSSTLSCSKYENST